MTRDECIAIILDRCGKRGNDQFLQKAAVREMKLVQETVLEMADFRPWFLLSEFLHANCGKEEPRMPLPERFLEEHEEGLVWVRRPGETRYIPLRRDDIDTLEERYLDSQPNIPEMYGVVKQYIFLFPTPNITYPMKMRCYRREPALTYDYGTESAQAVKTNAWLTEAPDWILNETGVVIAGNYLKDDAQMAKFKADAMAAKQRLYVNHVAREEANRTRSQGDD